MRTAQQIVERSLHAFDGRIAIIDGSASLSFELLRQRTAKLANALLNAVEWGSNCTAATLLPNDYRFIEVDLACMRAGVARVGISPRLAADECQYILAHANSSVLVTTWELYERIDANQLAALKQVWLIGESPTKPLHHTGRERAYDDVLALANTSLNAPVVGADHPAYIFYTSGTTGRPKGALHTHGSRVAAMINMLASELNADGRSTMVHCAPVTHGSGSKVLAFLAMGARNLVLPRFDPVSLARAVSENSATHSFMVPTMLQSLLDEGPSVVQSLRSMRQISFGGAPISAPLFARAVHELGPILTQVYGSCEAPHPITVLTPTDYSDSAESLMLGTSAGRPSYATEVKIVGSDGSSLATGNEGELCVRGAHLMAGYWQDASATAAVMSDDGWYSTGDIATIDERDCVWLRDRKRDLIITGGLNVYPSEVERVLSEHENVREVAVVGRPDERWGESIVAFIAQRIPGNATESELIAWVGSRLAGYKKPREIVFLPDLPKGSTNKILKRELKAQLWKHHERKIN